MNLDLFQTELISTMSSLSSNPSIEEYEDKISGFLSSPYFSTAIFNILQTQKLNPSIQSQSIILLKKFSENFDNFKTINEIEFLHKLVFLLSNSNFTNSEKKKFKQVLSHTLTLPVYDRRNQIINKMRGELIGLIRKVELTEGNVQLQDPVQLQTILLCLSAYISCCDDLVSIFVFEELALILRRLWELGIKNTVVLLATEKFNLSYIGNAETGLECEQYLTNIEIFAGCIKTIIKREKKYGNIKKRAKKLNQDHFEILNFLLPLRIGNLNRNSSNLFFRPTGFESLNEKLNSIQVKLFYGLVILYKIQKLINVNSSDFIEQYQTVIRIVLEALNAHFKEGHQNLGLSGPQTKMNRMVTISVSFLTLTSTNVSFFELFMEKRKDIVNNIILPNLRMSEDERENFEFNPSEFTRFSFDICGHKQSKTMKVFLVKLLDNISGSIDGTSTLIVLSVLDAIKYLLDAPVNNSANLREMYPNLGELQTSLYWTSGSTEDKIETGLLVLSVLRHFILARVDLKQHLQNFVQSYHARLTGPGVSSLIQARYIMLIMFSPHKILRIEKENSNSYVKVIELLQWILNQIQSDDAISKISATCFFRYLSKKKSTDILPYVFSQFVDFFVSILQKTQSTEYFSMVEKFMNKYGSNFNDKLQKLDDFLRATTFSILSSLEIQDEQKALAFLRIISSTINHKQLVINAFQTFDSYLSSLYPIFNLESKNVQNSLIEILLSLFSSTSKVGNYTSILFGFMPVVHQRNKYEPGELFWLLNTYLKLDRMNFGIDRIGLTINIVKDTITHGQGVDGEYTQASALLLLQALIEYKGDAFGETETAECLTIFKHFSDQLFSNDQKMEFILDKVLGVYFAMILFLKKENIEYLLNPSFSSSISQLVVENYASFYTEYETRLMLLGMIRLTEVLYFSGLSQCRQVISQNLNFLVPFLKLRQIRSVLRIYGAVGHKKTFEKYINTYYEINERISMIFPKLVNPFASYENIDLGIEEESIKIEDILNAEQATNSEKEQLIARFEFPIKWIDEYESFGRFIGEVLKTAGNFEVLKEMLGNNICFEFLDELVRRIRQVKVMVKKENEPKLRKILRIKRVV